jgi:long-subunit fatty acid transport protein
MTSALPPVETLRFTPCAIVAVVVAAMPSLATAQEWLLRGGAAARSEYSDNYFFTTDNPDSAFVASISPFVTAARRTETSEVAALLTVGANKVWGTNPNLDYLSGRAAISGGLREERSAWRGDVGYSRAPSLQSSATPDGIIFTLVYANAATANGAYTYQVDDRWTLEARAGGYDNRYTSVRGEASLQDNRGYSAGGSVRYTYSERTHLSVDAGYTYYSSDIERADSVTTVFGVAHSFSPDLKVSGSVGYFWSDTKRTQSASLNRERDEGPLFGGDLSYLLSDRSRLVVRVSERLTPTAAGDLSRQDTALAGFSYRATDRLTARVGASYTRDKFLSGTGSTVTNSYLVGEIGATYQIAERWTLDAGYRYTRASYPVELSEPRANVAFISIGYNWPDASFTNWVGSRPDTSGLPGAGPVPLTEPFGRTPSELSGPTNVDAPLFEPYFIP